MEVMVPAQDEDFSFDSANSVPVSPRGFENYFLSAPTSPLSQPSNDNYDYFGAKYSDNKAFAFSSSGDLDLFPLSSADELFFGAKYSDNKAFAFSTAGDLDLIPLSSAGEANCKKIIQDTMSFSRNNKVYSENFTVSKDNAKDLSSSTSSSVGWLRKKWRLKDLLLFRSASEGHETNKEYNILKKFKEDDLKNSSAKKKKVMSAHERHYKVKRAAAEEMRKRTYLPYKQNLMIGCGDLSAAGVSDPSRAAIRIR